MFMITCGDTGMVLCSVLKLRLCECRNSVQLLHCCVLIVSIIIYYLSGMQELDYHKVLEWVYFNRYPYFWNSELYYAFRLSHALGNRVDGKAEK